MIQLSLGQQVEGFAEAVDGEDYRASRARTGMGEDHRGLCAASFTPRWWYKDLPETSSISWRTGIALDATDTDFLFVGESSNAAEGAFPLNTATLYADDRRVVTFPLGIRTAQAWTEDKWTLQFTPTRVHSTGEGRHRQFNVAGCCGVYKLSAPASAVTAGQPITLKVVVEAPSNPRPSWFALRHREDVLRIDAETNAEQITQLQSQIIELKRMVGGLARRVNPMLVPGALPTEDVVAYNNGTTHVHDSDLVQLDNGDLLICLREGSEHLSNDGKTVTVRSADGGRTWGDRQVVQEDDHTDHREASMTQLRDGTLLMNSWVNPLYDGDGLYVGTAVQSYRGTRGGIWVGRSTDNGHTWTWPEDPIDPKPFTRIYTSERIVELPSGRLAMAIYFHERQVNEAGCSVYLSDDGGRTWRYGTTVANLSDQRLGEPALFYTAGDRLIMMMRNETAVSSVFYQSISLDEAATWSEPEPTPIPGNRNPPSLVQLPDGRLLCVHASRADPVGMYVVESRDEGNTWDMANRKVIRDDLPNWDMSYPSTVVLPSGEVYTAYYLNMFDRYFIVGSRFIWP